MLRDQLVNRLIDTSTSDNALSMVTRHIVEELALPLVRLGLSMNEAKVYACLVATGARTAGTLSMKAGVPRTKIYEVLRRLVDLGLVSEVRGRTTRFSPRAPSEVFISPLLSLKAKTKDLERTLQHLQEAYQKNEDGSQLQRAEIWMANGRETATATLTEMLSNAHHHVYLLTTRLGLTRLYRENFQLIERLKEKGVNVRIGVRFDSPRRGEKSINRGLQRLIRALGSSAEVTYIEGWPPLTYLCVDGSSFMVVKHSPDDLSSSPRSDELFFSYKPALCTMMNAVLSSMWNGKGFPNHR